MIFIFFKAKFSMTWKSILICRDLFLRNLGQEGILYYVQRHSTEAGHAGLGVMDLFHKASKLCVLLPLFAVVEMTTSQ